jgi:predicted nucleic acid-binding Zn ribbon protein
MDRDAAHRFRHRSTADPDCESCGATLVYVETEISSGAFRTQAASMPQIPIHFYDCPECGTCWKLGTRLMPDPVRQIARG